MNFINRYRRRRFEDICLSLCFDDCVFYEDERNERVEVGDLQEPTLDDFIVTQAFDSDGSLVSICANIAGPLIVDGPEYLVDGDEFLFESDDIYQVFESGDDKFQHRISSDELFNASGLVFVRTTVLSDKVTTGDTAEIIVERF